MHTRVQKLMLFAVLSAAAPAYAHHSFAMFDAAKMVSYSGTVKTVEWANPHVWISITVLEKGVDVPYSFECGAIAVLKRGGWTRGLINPGDKVTIASHPYKDGRAGGSVDHIVLSDGRQFMAGDGLPDALRPPGVE